MNDDLEQLYDKYAPVIYGSILQLVEDKNVADNILADAFLEIASNPSLLLSTKQNLLSLLRFSYCFTLKKLKELDIQPLPGKNKQERLVIDWLCTDCDSMESLLKATGLNRQQVKEELQLFFRRISNANR